MKQTNKQTAGATREAAPAGNMKLFKKFKIRNGVFPSSHAHRATS